MDPLHRALLCFQQRRFEEAANWATKALANNEYDEAVWVVKMEQGYEDEVESHAKFFGSNDRMKMVGLKAAWVVKMRSLTEQVYVDEVENDEEGIAESMMDDLTIATVPRPGTSLNKPKTAPKGTPSQAVRPRTNTGRPLSGFVRPGTRSGKTGSIEQALGAPRTATTARPLTAATGRNIRLGTASMLSSADGPFINVSRLNLSKYAGKPVLAKPLFEYLFYHENDVRNALHLASLATQAANFKDWFWKVQLGKCYYRLGMYRDAEKQFSSAAGEEVSLEVTLLLGKVYVRLDQPLSAMKAFQEGLDRHPGDVRLLTGLARLHEGINDLAVSVQAYKNVLLADATNVEAIASIATHYFYSDQPEVALRFYRRLLQMGVSNAELYCNIGLCCYYSQQWDLAVGCVEKALALVDAETAADVWYNVGHIALGGGDVGLAYQCFRLALAHDHSHAEAVTNLAVVEMRRGRLQQAKSLFHSATLIAAYNFEPAYNLALLSYQQAKSLFHSATLIAAYNFEPAYNLALLSYQTGDLQAAYGAVNRALDIFPEHADSKELKYRLDKLFADV